MRMVVASVIIKITVRTVMDLVMDRTFSFITTRRLDFRPIMST
jgi:hypothetical protein